MQSNNNNILLEKNRQELLHKQKKETPERIQRANSYSVSKINIDADALLNDWVVISTDISGNSKTYTTAIAFNNAMKDIILDAKNDSSHYVNSKLIIRSIKKSLDNRDIYISCNCDDFKFRYDYWATQGKFKWGKLQHSNGDKIRNPNNDIGCMCKHLYALLRSNKFLDKVSDKIMRTIMANLDVLTKRFNIDLTEFIVNTDRYDRLLKMNISRTKDGRFIKNNSNSDNLEKNIDTPKKENIVNESNNITSKALDSILQYFTTSQILEQFKEKTSDDEYVNFILKYGRANAKSLEDYLINNISEVQLMDYIKEFNSVAWSTLINEMLNVII